MSLSTEPSDRIGWRSLLAILPAGNASLTTKTTIYAKSTTFDGVEISGIAMGSSSSGSTLTRCMTSRSNSTASTASPWGTVRHPRATRISIR